MVKRVSWCKFSDVHRMIRLRRYQDETRTFNCRCCHRSGCCRHGLGPGYVQVWRWWAVHSLNYTFMNLESGNADADVGTLSAKVGVMATPYLGIEARGGFGVDDERIGGVDYSLDNFFGGYATFNLANESPITLTPFSALPGSKLKPLRSWAQRPRTKRTCLWHRHEYGICAEPVRQPRVHALL